MNYTEELKEFITANGNKQSTPMLIMQGITIGLVLLKPVFMYWIQAKYKAEPPHQSIREAQFDINKSDEEEEKSLEDKENVENKSIDNDEEK